MIHGSACRTVRDSTRGHIYFHAPCFDGIVSAVLVWDFFEACRGWRSVSLHPVNYDERRKWLRYSLRVPSAVVDFLYHPRAEFWADHHLTTFLSADVEANYRRRRDSSPLFYDRKAGSCAEVIWRNLKSRFGYRNERFGPLVRWAARLDAAKYRSVDEAVYARSPVLRIARTLALGDDRQYAAYLVRLFKKHSVDEIARKKAVLQRYQRAEASLERAIERMHRSIKVGRDGIATFDVSASNALFNRYAPYLFAPRAPYVAGIIRNGSGAKVTAMRNPWIKPGRVPLGEILQPFGGGGHTQVGSVILSGKRAKQARTVLASIVRQIRRQRSSKAIA